MKKDMNAQFRIEQEDFAAFRIACESVGVKASAVIRDLCAAAIPYMAEHCPRGRWIAPTLLPYGACAKTAEVLQVHSGRGHQRASVKKGGGKV